MATINDKIVSSTKWTFVTEVMAKLVSPISNLILARLLAPEAFGILATVMMVLSFAEMLADAGFQKYIIQKEFKDNREKEECTLVAIWSNILLALVLWLVIFIFKDTIASLVGNVGLGNVLAIAGVSILLTSITSVQLALLRREFLFKKLFFFRLCTIIVPLIITIPLAYLGYGYWSLVIGHIFAQLFLVFGVLRYSQVKLRLYYNFMQLQEMLSFSIWTLIESIAIWLTSWIDMFIVSSCFTAHYLGIYRMSMVSVNGLLSVISGAVIPVLYSALSRLQGDNNAFLNTFTHILRRTALIVLPIGVGVFVYKDIARAILFGDQWIEADTMIGLWGLTSCVTIIYCHFCSELYRAKGAPRVSFLAQMLHMAFLVPVLYVFSKEFSELVYARNLIRLQFILAHMLLLYVFFKVNLLKVIYSTKTYIIASIFMGCFVFYSRTYINNIAYNFISMALAVGVYFAVLCVFRKERNELKSIINSKNLY